MATTYQAIASQVLASTAASVTFSSIPGTYTDLKLVFSMRSNASNFFDYPYLAFNGDSSTNYSSLYLRGDGSTVSSSASATQTKTSLAFTGSGNTATANTFGSGEMYLPNYSTTGTKQLLSFGAGENNATGGNQYMAIEASLYRGTSAITSFVLTPAVGTNFLAGSRFDLYGITHI